MSSSKPLEVNELPKLFVPESPCPRDFSSPPKHSYLVRKARRVDLDDMQKWNKESDCSSWESIAFTKIGAHLNNFGRVCIQASFGNCEFRMSLRMMVDSSATEKQGSIVDVLSEKMKRVDISVEAGKVKAENLVVAIQFQWKKSHHATFLIFKFQRLMGKQSPCLEFLMVNRINRLMQLFRIPKGIHTVMMLTIYRLLTLEIRVQ